ncbi:MAG: type II toxin-antitoxin system RelE/ParE family toxin [Elusimicrobia bacterium]|nr:type II toxin-antitoxin system RelE/ParE family toxin [Elusimicrobiota bacterium]
MLTIEFYPDGSHGPVQEYFESLRGRGDRRKALSRLLADLDILVQEGLLSPRTSVRSLGQGLWELRRAYQGVHYRILFCVHRHGIWLLHAFEKTTQKTPLRDLHAARSRMANIVQGR